MKVVTLNFIEKFIYIVSNIALLNSMLLDEIILPIEVPLNGICAWAVPITVTLFRCTPLHSVLFLY